MATLTTCAASLQPFERFDRDRRGLAVADVDDFGLAERHDELHRAEVAEHGEGGAEEPGPEEPELEEPEPEEPEPEELEPDELEPEELEPEEPEPEARAAEAHSR